MPPLVDTLHRLLPPPVYAFGVGDLRGLLPSTLDRFPLGIAILRGLDDAIVDGIGDGPTPAYHAHYHAVNHELALRCDAVVSALRDAGHEALAVQPTLSDADIDDHARATLAAPISHKLVATRAGMGFIGKTDLLVSARFGPRLRLASVLTDAPLPVATPITESACGRCDVCVIACPAKAATGARWWAGLSRERFFDAHACRAYCRASTARTLGEDISLCGLCVRICPLGRSSSAL